MVQFLIEKGRRPIIYVLNQLDRFKPSEDSISETLNAFRNNLINLGDHSPTIIPTSAYVALLNKLGYDNMDEEEKYELELLKKKFTKDFYDLNSYIGEPSHFLLDKTGITALETTIHKII